MTLINNESILEEIKLGLSDIQLHRNLPVIVSPFTKDFSLRFCWSSNAIEGNTLSLDETVSVIEYDEVRSGHTYTEYQDAKNLYRAIEEMVIPLQNREITEEWIKKANGIIRGIDGEYRKQEVYIGSLIEAVFYPPDQQMVPKLMQELMQEINAKSESENVEHIFEKIAKQHIAFESIHPFQDGNGRVGRMIMNQQMINHGLLPIAINPAGKYRQAFQRFQKNGDASIMIHLMCKGELEAIQRIQCLVQKRSQTEVQIPEWTPKL